jgi:hypothetical protein
MLIAPAPGSSLQGRLNAGHRATNLGHYVVRRTLPSFSLSGACSAFAHVGGFATE